MRTIEFLLTTKKSHSGTIDSTKRLYGEILKYADSNPISDGENGVRSFCIFFEGKPTGLKTVTKVRMYREPPKLPDSQPEFATVIMQSLDLKGYIFRISLGRDFEYMRKNLIRPYCILDRSLEEGYNKVPYLTKKEIEDNIAEARRLKMLEESGERETLQKREKRRNAIMEHGIDMDFDIDPTDEQIRRAVALVRKRRTKQ